MLLAFLPATIFIGSCTSEAVATPALSPGTPGNPREVNIVARDFTFSPPVVDLIPGETVVLHVINGGLAPHEAVIGDQSVQDAWEVAQSNLPPTRPGVTPAISVPPSTGGLRIVVQSGQRVDVTWTVPDDATTVGGLIVGCHVAGHYARGMQVPVRVVDGDTMDPAR